MRRSMLGIMMLAIVLVVSSCGSGSGGTKDGGASASPAAQSVKPSPEPTESAFPRDITSAGKMLTIQKQPLKVGVASWTFMEMMFLFDVPSVGLTVPFAAAKSSLESEVYKPYADKFKELKVVGESAQVNLESMLAYAPDVIVAGSKTNAAIKDQLEKIAPTVWVDEEKINVRQDWQQVVSLFGNVLGQEKRAKDAIDQFAAKQNEGKAKLAAHNGESVMFAQVREKAVYVMSADSLPQYYKGLDLTPPSDKGMAATAMITLEGLSAINPDHLVLGYFNWTDKFLPALTDDWQKSEVWKSLKAVKNNHVYGINGELALGIGPIGQTYGINALVNAVK